MTSLANILSIMQSLITGIRTKLLELKFKAALRSSNCSKSCDVSKNDEITRFNFSWMLTPLKFDEIDKILENFKIYEIT